MDVSLNFYFSVSSEGQLALVKQLNSNWAKKNRETNCTGMWSRVFEIQQTLIKIPFPNGREETLELSSSTCSVCTLHYLLFWISRKAFKGHNKNWKNVIITLGIQVRHLGKEQNFTKA